jgi:hypothetical protein
MQIANLLAEPLGDGVRVGWRLVRRAHGGGIEQPGAMLRTPFEEVQGGAHVFAHGAGRVRPRPGRVGNPGEVQYRVATGDELSCGGIARIEVNDGLVIDRCPQGPTGSRESKHLVAAIREQRARPPSQEPARAGDQDLHGARYPESRCW